MTAKNGEKICKKLISTLLIWVTAFSIQIGNSTAMALTSQEKEEKYNNVILELESFMESSSTLTARLDSLLFSLDELGGYEQSKPLSNYISVLIKVINNEFDYDYQFNLEMVDKNKEFQQYLKDTLKSSSILTVSHLKNYATGRENEYNNKIDNALKYYEKCLNFFDASTRYQNLTEKAYDTKYEQAMKLFREGKFEEAYFLFQAIGKKYKDTADRMAYIVKRLGYTPSKEATKKPTDTPNNPFDGKALNLSAEFEKNSIQLSWNNLGKNVKYTIYWRWTKSKNSNFAKIEVGNETSYTHKNKNARNGYKYQYYIIASDGVNTISSPIQEVVFLAKNPTTPKPRQKAKYNPTPKNDPTPIIVTPPPKNEPTVTTPPKNKPTVTTPPPPVYSAWSDWSTTPVSGSATRQIKTKTESTPIYTVKYTYSRWKYWRTSTNAWGYSYAQYMTTPSNGGVYGGKGRWEYKTTTSKLAINHYTDGRPVYNGTWYNQSEKKEQTGTQTTTYYSYRDLIK